MFRSVVHLPAGYAMVFAGCSDDDDELQQTAFGYVQFKIYKSASVAIKGTETRGTDMLDKLNDAKKIKVVMLYDGNTIEQTLMLTAIVLKMQSLVCAVTNWNCWQVTIN